MNVDEKELKNVFKGKKILVTGGTGSIGSQIVFRLLKYEPEVIRVFANDENAIFLMQQELKDHDNLRFLLGDIRDSKRLIRALEDIEIVFHAAALKHVPLCEYNPFEAVQTNVLGTQNLIDAALKVGVKKVINISTDKAVNPANTMGATKLLAEKLIIDANFYRGDKETVFANVRFGNVLYSRGSVLRIFEEEIINNKPITVTDPNMTRFMMSITDTINLVFKATQMALNGEIFILKMPVIRTGDLATAVIEKTTKELGKKKSDVKIVEVGRRPGEKVFEELMTETEAGFALETEEMFIVLPQLNIHGLIMDPVEYKNSKETEIHRYASSDFEPLSKDEIIKLLIKSRENSTLEILKN